MNLKIYVVSNVLRAQATKINKTHIQHLKLLDKFQSDLERSLPVAVKYDFVAKNRPMASEAKKAFFPIRDLENNSFLFPLSEMALIQINPIFMDLPLISGFGQLESEEPGFLGDLSDLNTQANFWQILQNKRIKTLLVNSTDLVCNRFLLETMDSKPPGLTILWFFSSQKFQRSAIRRLKNHRLQFLSFPTDLFIDNYKLLISKYSHLYVSDLLPDSSNPSSDVTEFLSIH